MKNILIIISVLIAAIINAQELDPYQFFPASVGDRWEYSVPGPGGTDAGYIETVIRDSLSQKDSSRFVFYNYYSYYYDSNNNYQYFNFNDTTARYRIDKHYNVFWSPQSGNWHRYKLDAKVGDSWMFSVGPPRRARVREIYQGFVFGKVTTIMTIDFFLLTRGDTVITENSWLQWWEKLAYGFGMISREDGVNQPYLLRGARINGITYGTVDIEEESQMIPTEFALYQNYPNPFNPHTIISYQSAVGSYVTLKVYDMLGREVATLVNEYQQPGTYNSQFSIINYQLSSGVYFYTLQVGDYFQSKKMLLLK